MHRYPLHVLALVLAVVVTSACSKAAARDETAQDPGKPASDPAAATNPASASGAAAATNAKPGEDVYGTGVGNGEKVTIAEVLANPQSFAGKTVQVEGTVTDVCPKRGCWFEMAGQAPGQKMRFKVQDGVMVFPMTAKGKHAVAEGVVNVQTLSLEETRAYLEYQAKEYGSEVDPTKVTEPMTVVRLDGKGAVLGNAR